VAAAAATTAASSSSIHMKRSNDDNDTNSCGTASTAGALEKQMDDSTKKKLFDSTTTSSNNTSSNQDESSAARGEVPVVHSVTLEKNHLEERPIDEKKEAEPVKGPTKDLHALALDDLLSDKDEHVKGQRGVARDQQVTTPSTVAATVDRTVDDVRLIPMTTSGDEQSSGTERRCKWEQLEASHKGVKDEQQLSNNPWNVSLKSRKTVARDLPSSSPGKRQQGQEHRIHSWKHEKAYMGAASADSVNSQTKEFPQDDPNLSAYNVWHKKGLLPWSPAVSKGSSGELATSVTMETEDCGVTLEPSIVTNASSLTGDDMDESSSTWRSKCSPARPKSLVSECITETSDDGSLRLGSSSASSGLHLLPSPTPVCVTQLTTVFRQQQEMAFAVAGESDRSLALASPSLSFSSSSTAVSQARMKKAVCAARARHVSALTQSRSISRLKSRSATQLCWFGTDENIVPLTEVEIDSTSTSCADSSILSESKSPPRGAAYASATDAGEEQRNADYTINSSADEFSSVGSPSPLRALVFQGVDAYQSYVSAYKNYAKDRSSSTNREMQLEAEQRLVDRRGFLSPANNNKNMPNGSSKKKSSNKQTTTAATTTTTSVKKMEQWEKLKEERRDRMKKFVRGESGGSSNSGDDERGLASF
jgi:hypothetical protein